MSKQKTSSRSRDSSKTRSEDVTKAKIKDIPVIEPIEGTKNFVKYHLGDSITFIRFANDPLFQVNSIVDELGIKDKTVQDWRKDEMTKKDINSFKKLSGKETDEIYRHVSVKDDKEYFGYYIHETLVPKVVRFFKPRAEEKIRCLLSEAKNKEMIKVKKDLERSQSRLRTREKEMKDMKKNKTGNYVIDTKEETPILDSNTNPMKIAPNEHAFKIWEQSGIRWVSESQAMSNKGAKLLYYAVFDKQLNYAQLMKAAGFLERQGCKNFGIKDLKGVMTMVEMWKPVRVLLNLISDELDAIEDDQSEVSNSGSDSEEVSNSSSFSISE